MHSGLCLLGLTCWAVHAWPCMLLACWTGNDLIGMFIAYCALHAGPCMLDWPCMLNCACWAMHAGLAMQDCACRTVHAWPCLPLACGTGHVHVGMCNAYWALHAKQCSRGSMSVKSSFFYSFSIGICPSEFCMLDCAYSAIHAGLCMLGLAHSALHADCMLDWSCACWNVNCILHLACRGSMSV
jgi:hypothetical protein